MRKLSTFLWLTFSLGGLYACSGGTDSTATTSSGAGGSDTSGASNTSSTSGTSSASGAGTTSSSSSAGSTSSASSSTSGAGGGSGAGGSGAGGGGAGGGGSATCSPTTVKCSDQIIQDLNFQTDITKGLITNEPDGAGWISTFDATAGGAFTPDPESYTYGIFTSAGVTKVSISDQDSLDSTAWDIGFRRFIGRINSGNSGPSCVKSVLLGNIASWDTITEFPANASLKDDVYYDDMCVGTAATQGLGSPETALAYFWEYPKGCLKMTGNVYGLELADGRRLKLSVLAFYSPDVQALCDADQTIPMTNTGSAHIRVRWAFLP